ncbi:hypothetical protein [Micrococcus luteus]|uniref:hypothetical protein n=1 Tax=Micrococcus luteus TaxID=1270 RepID=UPI003675D383
MTDQRTATDPGDTPGAVAVPAGSADLLAELVPPARDTRPRAVRRTGNRAQRAEAADFFTLVAAMLATELAGTEDAAAPVEYVAPVGPDALPPDHPARVLLARAEGPGGLYAHAEAATTGATLDDLPAKTAAELDADHLRTPETVHQCAAQHYRARWRAGLDGVAARALALALLSARLAEALTRAAAEVDTPAAPAEALAQTWPPPWQPPPAHLALTTSTLTAAPPATHSPVLAPRACVPMAA